MAEVPIDIAHIARLARIALTEDESARFSAQFARLFDFIKELQALDVDHVHPTEQVIPLSNVMRDDEITTCLTQGEALANAPDSDGRFFRAPRILE